MSKVRGKDGKFKSKTTENHISESVFPCPNTGCWWWAGSTYYTGYGRFNIGAKTVLAHRAIYSHYTGRKLTSDISLCHTCDNKLCVNPDHLFEGDAKANAQDLVAKNKQIKGVDHGCAKLNEHQVLTIRELFSKGESKRGLARKYNVHPRTVDFIISYRNWAWLQ